MRGTLLGASSLLLLVPALASCASTEEKYCGQVRAHQEELTDIAARGDAGALFDALDVYRELADEAPRDVRDEWATVIDAIERLETVLEDVGIDPTSYDPADPPEELSDDDRERLAAAATGLADPDVQAAMDGVEQQARDVCHTPLSL